MYRNGIKKSEIYRFCNQALIALVGRLSLSVGRENCPERGLNTVSFNP